MFDLDWYVAKAKIFSFNFRSPPFDLLFSFCRLWKTRAYFCWIPAPHMAFKLSLIADMIDVLIN